MICHFELCLRDDENISHMSCMCEVLIYRCFVRCIEMLRRYVNLNDTIIGLFVHMYIVKLLLNNNF